MYISIEHPSSVSKSSLHVCSNRFNIHIELSLLHVLRLQILTVSILHPLLHSFHFLILIVGVTVDYTPRDSIAKRKTACVHKAKVLSLFSSSLCLLLPCCVYVLCYCRAFRFNR